jgi:hypothetical protein
MTRDAAITALVEKWRKESALPFDVAFPPGTFLQAEARQACAQELADTLSALGGRPETGWQRKPISEAPKDGTDVLTVGMAGYVVARWEDDAWRVYNYGYEDATVRKQPTHFYDLPSPPLQEQP